MSIYRMIDAKYPVLVRERRPLAVNHVFFKAVIAVLFCVLTVQVAPLLGPIATFICLDLILSIYLASLFRGKYRYLFLIHPAFSLISSFGFEIPYTEIGVGYTYLNTFQTFVDSSTLTLDFNLLAERLREGGGPFGLGVVYVGSLPILWLPSFLFPDPPDIVIYLSLGVFTMLYGAIAASLALFFRVIRRDVLLIIILFSTVSPTFLEINGSLHRYGLLFLGLFLFFMGYVGIIRKRVGLHSVLLLVVIVLSFVFVAVSKAVLFYSLALFIVLERLSANKMPLISAALVRLDKATRIIMAVIGIATTQYLASFVVPEKYVLVTSQSGGQYPGLVNMPVLGLTLRLIYATLSPFPWVNFSQYDLYGFNILFLWLHVFSALLASWIIFSLFFRLRLILKGADDVRISAIFGAAILSSLAFSSIGFHVYLAPALPFLAAILCDKRNRIKFIYPIGFCVFMEVLAQTARIIR